MLHRPFHFRSLWPLVLMLCMQHVAFAHAVSHVGDHRPVVADAGTGLGQPCLECAQHAGHAGAPTANASAQFIFSGSPPPSSRALTHAVIEAPSSYRSRAPPRLPR